MKRIVRRPLITAEKSQEMIFGFVRASDHTYPRDSFRSPEDVVKFFESRGYVFKELVEHCRDPRNNVPVFENLLTQTWSVGEGEVGITSIGVEGRARPLAVPESSQFTLRNYARIFEAAAKSREKAIDEKSFDELETAITKGVTSVDAFLNHCAARFNRSKGSEILKDSRKMSVSRKIDEWIPKICSGRAFDRTASEYWKCFESLRDARNEEAIHPKETGKMFRLEDLVAYANMFRFGIAGLLIDLHLLVPVPVPAAIIRCQYAPDVVIIDEDSPSAVAHHV
jgi:hypothetical protein